MVDLFDLSEAPGTTETLSFVIITRPSMRSLFGGSSLSPVASYCEISYIVSSSLFFLFFLTFVLLPVQVIRSPSNFIRFLLGEHLPDLLLKFKVLENALRA